MTSKRKRLFLGIVLTILVTFALCALDRTVDNITYEYDNILNVTGDKSNIISETEQVAPGNTMTIVLYTEYNQAIFTINTRYLEYGYDEADVETLFKNFIETWIQNKDHRYYSYLVNKHKTFHSRKDSEGNKIVSNEYKVTLYRK